MSTMNNQIYLNARHDGYSETTLNYIEIKLVIYNEVYKMRLDCHQPDTQVADND